MPPDATPPPNVPVPVPPPDTVSAIASQPHSPVPTANEVYATICSQIIKEQGRIIGVLSYEQANGINGLDVDKATYTCVITGDGNQVLAELVEKYREFFGNAAVQVCREAASHLITNMPNEQLPALLRG